MIGPETAAFLESGCALVVGTVDGDGAPCAARAWGLTVLGERVGSDGRVEVDVRLLIDADDDVIVDNLRSKTAVAITGGDVRTLRSMQLKGRSFGVEPTTEADELRAERYIDAFVSDIEEADRTPTELIRRLIPARFVACTASVAALYDQTPGPGAGAPMKAER